MARRARPLAGFPQRHPSKYEELLEERQIAALAWTLPDEERPEAPAPKPLTCACGWCSRTEPAAVIGSWVIWSGRHYAPIAEGCRRGCAERHPTYEEQPLPAAKETAA